MTTHDRPQWRRGSQYAAAFRPLDRNARARLLYLAEALDRRTKEPGRHGGFLGRTGLAVLRALVTRFLDHRTGRLDPSIASIARAANVARSTAQAALDRLQAAGIIERTRRMARIHCKVWNPATCRREMAARVVQVTNAYRLNFPLPDRATFGNLAHRAVSPDIASDTGKRSGTTNLDYSKAGLGGLPQGPLHEALDRLAKAMGRCGLDGLKEAQERENPA